MTTDTLSVKNYGVPSAPLRGMGTLLRADLFRVVAGVLLPGGGAAVANAGSGEIYVFDEEGVLVQRMGGLGAGPAEFSMLGGLRASPDGTELTAVDWRLGIKRFNTAGELLGTVQIPMEEGSPRDAPMNAEGTRFVLLEQASRSLGTIHRLQSTGVGPELASVSSGGSIFLRFRDRPGGISLTLPYAARPWMATLGECTVFTGGSLEDLVMVRPEGDTAIVVDLPDSLSNWGDGGFRAELENRIDATGHGAEIDLDGVVGPAQRAPWRDGIHDASGRIWLTENHLATQPASAWTVVLARGLELRRVLAAEGVIGLLDVRGSRALVLTRDAFDVESVWVAPLPEGIGANEFYF